MAESSSSNFGIPKLNNSNYQVWKYKVEKLLKREGTWRAISTQKPTNEQDAIEIWEIKDEKAQGTICLLLEDDQTAHTQDKTSAKEIWDALETYHQKASGINKFSLVVELLQLKLGEGEDMERHISKIQDLINRLKGLGSKGITEFGPWIIRHSMPSSYHTLISVLASKPEEELTLDSVKATLIGEAKRRKMTESVCDSALRVHSHTKHVSKCYFCGSTEHMKQDCPKYLRWKQMNKRKRQEKARAVLEEETLSDSDSGSGGDESTWLQQAFSVSACKQKQRINKQEWYLDSAASSHMTNDITFFDEIDATYTSKVRVANGNSCLVYGIGRGKIDCLTRDGEGSVLELDKVLYIPQFESGLISIGSLDKQGYQIKIKNNQMSISKDNREIAVGTSVSHMYRLKTPEYAFAVLPHHPSNCIHFWHRRFAHRDPKAIRQLMNKNLTKGMTIEDCTIKQVCESCVKGKQCRKPFPLKSETSSTGPLELMHTDICGPMSTATPGGRRYAMTLIDDYSKYTYCYLLTHKSQAELVIKQFLQYSKTQFGKRPKILRSDRGGEYIGHSLKEYLQNKGIEFQHTMPYTPEQNGLAERKNRYLMEAVRTMLIDARLPNTYWGEAAITATYLQNRLPTRSRSKTPYELWFNQKPNVSHLRTFDCRAYAHIPKQRRNKLHPKATECVLLGYPEGSKGYRLLERSSGKIIASRDVTFLEEARTEGEVENPCNSPLTIESEAQEKMSEPEQQIIYVPNESTEDEYPNVKDKSSVHSISSGEVADQNSSYEDAAEQGLTQQDKKDEYVYDKENEVNEAEPKTYEEAMNGPHAEEWLKAIEEELNSLKSNETWNLEPVPKNKKMIGCK